MKLTDSQRKAFVRAVMDDTPYENYYEKGIAIVQNEIVKEFPPALKAVYDDVKLRVLLRTMYILVKEPRVFSGYYFYHPECREFVASEPIAKKLKDLAAKNQAQSDERQKIENQLRAGIRACNTLKQAQGVFPDLLRYLPSEPGKTGNLPAVIDVMPALKAAGFPKKEEQND